MVTLVTVELFSRGHYYFFVYNSMTCITTRTCFYRKNVYSMISLIKVASNVLIQVSIKTEQMILINIQKVIIH